MKPFIKTILLIVFAATITIRGFADNKDDITLIVTSDGPTKDAAIKNALRTAIEQAYGVFVSSNTDILNDEIVKDEIATISSGNIKRYNEVSVSNSPGITTATIEVTISKGKLVYYAKSKGPECELDGAAMSQDIELKLLYKANEEIAISNLMNEFNSQLDKCFDYTIQIDNITWTDEERLWIKTTPYKYTNCGNLYEIKTTYNDDKVFVPYKVMATLNKFGVQAIHNLYARLGQIGSIEPTIEEICKICGISPKELKKKAHRAELGALDLYNIEQELEAQKGGQSLDFPFILDGIGPAIVWSQIDCFLNDEDAELPRKLIFRSDKSVNLIRDYFAKTISSPINEFLRNYTIHFGDALTVSASARKSEYVQDYKLLTYNDGYVNVVRRPICQETEEYYFHFGIIELSHEDLKKLRNVRVVHN